MEIVLIRHGQPEWVKDGEYTVDPGLTEIGKKQAEKSASFFSENSMDEIWVSPLSRAQETLKPFEERNIAPKVKTFEWLREALDDDEKKLIGESQETIREYFDHRNTRSFEDWMETTHGAYMKGFSENIIKNFDESLHSVLLSLAKRVAADGEGASKFVSVSVLNSKNFEDAKKIAFSIANSSLVKTAIAADY